MRDSMPMCRSLGLAMSCLLALVLAALAGCAPGAPPAPPPAPATAATPGIAWFDGTPEQAFARARADNRPVFLYWSASWCPPCHELKAHVFSRPEVIERARAFVAVYVDGDQDGAQKLGERFHVLGYPTAVVLRPDGTEITRVGGGMDLEAYADALDVGLADRRPIAAILAALERPDAADLPLEDCRRLAFHGWGAEVGGDPAARARGFEQAIERCPATASLERARLALLAGQALAASESRALQGGAPPSSRLAGPIVALQALLRDAKIAPRLADLLRNPDDALLAAARRTPGVDPVALRDAWVARLMATARDPLVSPGVQLSSAGAALQVYKGMTATPPPATLATEARRLTEAALARYRDGFARTGVVNGASWVYAALDDRTAARALLEHEVRTSANPHYYLSDLADLAESEGDASGALRYFAQAYERVEGPASRFQWGVLYAQGLLRLAPRDTARIEQVTSAVLGELDGPDRLYTRSRVRLAQLDAGLRRWRDADPARAAPVLDRLRRRIAPICARYEPRDPARADCDRFLAAPAAG